MACNLNISYLREIGKLVGCSKIMPLHIPSQISLGVKLNLHDLLALLVNFKLERLVQGCWAVRGFNSHGMYKRGLVSLWDCGWGDHP